MNAKEFYRAIGQIDEELILAAGERSEKRKKHAVRLWAMTAAACFCLIIGGAYMHFWGVSVVWNEGTAEYAAKSVIPADSAARMLTADELSAYYQVPLPDALNGGLYRTDADARICTNAQGTVVYDRNVVRYESADGVGSLNLTLSRVTAAPQTTEREAVSRVRGTAVTLTEDASIPGYLMLGAQWERNGTTVHLSSEGLDKKAFITVLKELI